MKTIVKNIKPNWTVKVLGRLIFCPMLIALPTSFGVAKEAKFNPAFLYQLTGQPIDTEIFRYGNPINSGEYLADIYVNDEFVGQEFIVFKQSPSTEQNPMSGLCWSQKLADKLPIKPEHKPAVTNECASAVQQNPQLGFRFDITTHELHVSIPQSVMVVYPRGYIDKARWQDGVPAAFLKYQVNGYHYHDKLHDASSHQQFLGVQAGVNLGRWSVRHGGSMSWQNGDAQNYQYQYGYAQRDLDEIDGRLKIGDFSTQSTLLDNIDMHGVSVMSDVRMLPNSRTGYAPEVHGFARTNAKVQIRQNGHVIHESTVGAGAFVIDDLYAFSSSSGDLQVSVLEADGTTQEFIVPFSQTSNMLRPHQLRYHMALGHYRQNNEADGSPLLHTSWHYGLSNHWTIQAGLIAHKDYLSSTFGAIWGSRFGAWSADINSTQAKIQTVNQSQVYQDDLQATKLHLGYHKYLNASKTHISADVYHHFDKHQTSLSSVLLGRGAYNNPIKNQYRLSINQTLGKNLGGLYVSGLVSDYWQGKSRTNYQVGYSNHYKNWQYRLGLTRTYYANSTKHDNQAYIHVYVPFYANPRRKHRGALSSSYMSTSHVNQVQASFNRTAGEQNQYQYGITASKQSHARGENWGVSGNVNAVLPMSELGLSASYYDRERQYSYSLSGAVVAHQYGLTLANDLGDTFAIIHAKGAKGTPIDNHAGGRIDRFGNGVATHLLPYQMNHVSINANYLPQTVEIDATGKDVIPRANTTQMITFGTKMGRLVLFDLYGDHQNAITPPLNTQAKSNGVVVGQVVQDGRILARLDNDKGIMVLTWGQNTCRFEYHFEKSSQDGADDMLIYPVRCQ